MKKQFCILLFLLLFASCKKEYSVETVPQVITIGGVIEVKDNFVNKEKAVYWINSTFYYVEPLSNTSTYAVDIVKWNGNVFILGEYSDGSKWIPCYWLRGKRYSFNLEKFISYYPFFNHFIKEIKIYDNTLYIIPDGNIVYNKTPIIVKVKDIYSIPEIITLKPPPSTTFPPDLSLQNVCVSNNSILVFGQYVNNVNYLHPCIWEIDPSNQVKVITPENDLTKQFPTVIGCATDKQTYIIGINEQETVIWNKAGRFLTLHQPANYNRISSDIKCKIDDKGDLYIISSAFNYSPSCSSNAQVWKITPNKTFSEFIIPVPSMHNGYSFGLDILGNDYAFGAYHIKSLSDQSPRTDIYEKFEGIVQLNNKQIALDIPDDVKLTFMTKIKITRSLVIYN